MDKWKQIPDELLLHIFRFLKEADLAKASCVCRKWRKIFHDSSLWRTRNFEFSGFHRSPAERLHRLSGYVSSLGCHLQNLRLACPCPNLMTAYGVAQAVRTLLTELASLPGGRVTLRTFTVCQLNFDESWEGFRASKHILVTSFCNFLQSQCALQMVELENAFMTPPFSYRVLRAVGTSRSRTTIRKLNVVNLFCYDTPARFVGKHFRTILRRFWQLRELSLNYCYLQAAGVGDICEALSDTLVWLKLSLDVLDQNRGEVILSSDWSHARVVCPQLKVSLQMHCWPRDPTMVLVASLPLCELVVRGRQCWRSSISVGSKLGRIMDCIARYYYQTLESAIFSAVGVNKFTPPSQESLARFLFRCSRLKRLVFSDSLMTPSFMAKVKAELSNPSKKVVFVES